MTVRRGSSAMLPIVRADTKGDLVYLYDAESARGNATYAFRAVRLENPTTSALESGPVTVYGDGRFIGEGIAEPIPARGTAFVPFSLDRQVLVEPKTAERDEVARLVSVNRGVLRAEVRHTRRRILEIANRGSEPASVWVRHAVARGYELARAPDVRERMGGAWLFRVEVPAGRTGSVEIEETTPVERSIDLRSAAGIERIRVHAAGLAADAPLSRALRDLVQRSDDVARVELAVAARRTQLADHRERTAELHGQLVSLRGARAAHSLVRGLERRLAEANERVSESALELARLQEQLLVARGRLEDGVRDLTLGPSS